MAVATDCIDVEIAVTTPNIPVCTAADTDVIDVVTALVTSVNPANTAAANVEIPLSITVWTFIIPV